MLAATVLLMLFLLLFAGLWYIYRLSFYYRDPQRDPRQYWADEQTKAVKAGLDAAIELLLAAPYEPVSITSHDGLTLTGKYYHTADGAPLQIICHGYKGQSARDCSGLWASARKMGCNVLLIDHRCHGGSEGRTITFGILEHRDCLDWVAYACRRFGTAPVYLAGVSMGAATVLMAVGRDMPECVRGVIADCPYDSPREIIRKVLAVEMKLPAGLVYPFVRLSAWLLGGFDLEAFSPLEAVQRSVTPILLIHGDDDRFVPCDMSRRLHAAAPEIITFHTVPGAGHGLSQVTDPETYGAWLAAFLEKTGGVDKGVH